MQRPTALDFQVVTAVVAEIRRYGDIGDIHDINQPGHLLSISRLPRNRILVVVYKKLTCQKMIAPLFDLRVIVTRGLTIPTGAPTDDFQDDLQEETSICH